MHVRRSVLSLYVCGAFLISLILIIGFGSRSGVLLSWASGWTTQEHDIRVVDILRPADLGHSWPEPVPDDYDLRIHPTRPQDNDDNVADGFESTIRVSSTLLRTRLQALLDAPVQSHSAAVAENEKACPRGIADKQVNQDQLKGNLDKWISVGESEIRSRRTAIVHYLERLERTKIPVMGATDKDTGEGRGIVMTAGNKDTAHRALVVLRMLRLEYRSNLPVQIFSFPGELKDKVVINEMLDLGATHHEAIGLQKVPNAWKNFHLKAVSIISSSFAEVLYLDNDNIPLRDPAYLFDDDSYKSTGTVFWPDVNKDHPDNAVWRVLGKTCNYSEWEVESGQILIDKRGNEGLNLAALHVAAHMQAENDFWFSLSGGDKDTFRYAFWALGANYLVAPRWLSLLGISNGCGGTWSEKKFGGLVMLQYDIVKNEKGQFLPLFVHANLMKHLYGGALRNRQYFETIKRARHDESNDRRLDRLWTSVYQGRGMCIDLEVDSTDNDSGKKIVTEKFAEVYDGAFKDFEGRFFRHKGKVGGW